MMILMMVCVCVCVRGRLLSHGEFEDSDQLELTGTLPRCDGSGISWGYGHNHVLPRPQT